MRALFVAALLLIGGVVFAEQKAASDKDVPSADVPKTDKKTDKPDDKLPTPGELIKKLKSMEKEKAKKSKIAYFDLSLRPVVEQPAAFSLFGDDGSMTLRSIVDRLHQA